MADHAEKIAYRNALTDGIIMAVRNRIETHGGTYHSRQIRGAVEVLAERIAELAAALPAPPQEAPDAGQQEGAGDWRAAKTFCTCCHPLSVHIENGCGICECSRFDPRDLAEPAAALNGETLWEREAARLRKDLGRLRGELADARQQKTESYPGAAHVVGKKREGGGRDEPLHYYLVGPRRKTEAEALADLKRWGGLQEGEPVAWAWRWGHPNEDWKATTSRQQVKRAQDHAVDGVVIGEVRPLFFAAPPPAAPDERLREAVRAMFHMDLRNHEGVCTGCGATRAQPHHDECPWVRLRAALDAAPPATVGPLSLDAADLLADLRYEGWAVAVHNDYRQGGEQRTFWLLTRDGHAIKGEGRSDAEALAQCRASVDAAPVAAPPGERPKPDDAPRAARPYHYFRVHAHEYGTHGVVAWTGKEVADFAHPDSAAVLARDLNSLFNMLAAAPPAVEPPPEGEQPFRVEPQGCAWRIVSWTGVIVDVVGVETLAIRHRDLLNDLFAARPSAAPPPAVSDEPLVSLWPDVRAAELAAQVQR